MCCFDLVRCFTLAATKQASVISESAHNAFLRELAVFELEFSKLESVSRICNDETQHFNQLKEEIAQDIVKTQSEISKLQTKLVEEQLIRQRKEECEALAKKVNTETPRAVSGKEIEETNAELALLQEKHRKVQVQFELREKQFRLLIHSIVELNHLLASDSDA